MHPIPSAGFRRRAKYALAAGVAALLCVAPTAFAQPATKAPAPAATSATPASPEIAAIRKSLEAKFPGADIKHIFDKFYRAGDEMTRKTKGSGLGLAIVKQILDAHRAQIKVNSKLNEGTEMAITFPKGKHA